VKRLVALLPVLALAGCVTTGSGSETGGECKVFERPPYAVKGQTQYDQDVADNFVESGVGGCKWTRPAPRPVELNASPAPKAVPKPIKKHTLIQRVKSKVWPKIAVTPVTIVPETPSLAVVPVAVIPPRSAIDDLLLVKP
jgi:hypothetical protein